VTKKVEARVVVSDATDTGELLVGEFVNIAIAVGDVLEERGAYLVPLGAVRTGASGAFVYTVGSENRLIARGVELGRIIGESIEIVQGVDPGMRIVAAARGLNAEQVVRIAE
jgi:hypothetical protein